MSQTGSETDLLLRDRFLKWQCRVRQVMMRDGRGYPDASIMPHLLLSGEEASFGVVITILNKLPSFSVTPELQHMARSTHDPAQRRERALEFLAATHYQKPHEFSDVLTATFSPDGAARIIEAGTCRLRFEAYAQIFVLSCLVRRLAERDPLYLATLAHNRLFNPNLPGDSLVLGFEPDWSKSVQTSS